MAGTQADNRLQVVEQIQTRDATMAYDSKVINGLVEQGQDAMRAVKRGGLTVAYTGVPGIGQGIYDYLGILYGVSGDYLNQYTTAGAQLPTLVTANAGFSARDGAAGVGFIGQLWVIGGNNAAGLLNDAWVSINGTNWSQNTAVPAGVTGRTGGKAIVLNNVLYVMGGQDDDGNYLNDVWSTPDGQTWTEVLVNAPWGPRADFEILVLNNTIYIAGGQGVVDTLQITPGLWHDVWSSANGTAWTQQTAAAPWIGRRRFGFYSVGSALYVLGGMYNGLGYFTTYQDAVADLWTDGGSLGVTWTRVNSNAFGVAGCPMLAQTVITSEGLCEPYGTTIVTTNGTGGTGAVAQRFVSGDTDVEDQEWCEYYEAPTVTFMTVGSGYTSACDFTDAANGDNIFLLGYGFLNGAAVSGGRAGEVVYDNGNYFYFTTYINGAQSNEIWTSTDGINWTLLTAAPGYATRSMQAFTFGNMWVIGGSTAGTTYYNDVWSLGIGTTSFALDPTVAGEFYNFNQTATGIATPLMVFKSAHQGYTFNASLDALARITNANYPPVTVPGLVYLDTTFYVMDPDGKIWGSALNDPTTWTALNEIALENEPNGGAAIAKCGTYLVGYGQWSCEFFYDNGNAPPGSPLSANVSLAYQVGCANGRSMVQMEGTNIWIGQTVTEGAKVYIMQGYAPTVISTPFVDRVIQNDPLTMVYSFATQHFGHPCYVLTLVTSGITLVYDFVSQVWYKWTSTLPAASVAISSLSVDPFYTSSYASVTVSTAPNAHGMSDGDPAIIAGSSVLGYDGYYSFNVIDQYTLQYSIGGFAAASSAGTVTPYTYGYYRGVDGHELSNTEEGSIGGSVFVQDPLNGQVYVVTYNTGGDYGNPVDFNVVTPRWDGGVMREKYITRASIVGDMTSSTMQIRHSENDYQTWSLYRSVNMQASWPYLTSMGMAHRTAYQIRHTAFTPQRVEAIEIEYEVGV